MIHETGDCSINGWGFYYTKQSFRADRSPEATLEIIKNPSGRSPRAGIIILNHRRIPLKRFLHSQKKTFTSEIGLHRHNRLRVFLFGSPGASISIVIHDSSATPSPTAAFSATPETIPSGSASTLAWTTTHTDTCHIEPNIGSVAPNGSMTVSPDATTMYTLTATGPGGSTSSTVTVTVNRPAPTVNLTVQPAEILTGESTVLKWSSANADTCRIDPDVGAVELQGELAVSPTETTTYTLAATGSGGSASASAFVTVTQPEPTVTLSVDPQEIVQGGTTTLTWTSEFADSCSISPDVGPVGLSGSISVSPTEDTTYTITASGTGGTASSTVEITIRSPINLQLLSPVDGSVVNRPDVLVQGTFDNSTGSETGITVNGMLAMVHGNRFVLNHLPLLDGANTITVTATDINGQSATATAAITVDIPENYIQLLANIESASSPLEATLQINGTFSIEDATVSYIGGTPDELMEIEPDEYQLHVAEEGITYLTAEVVHETIAYTDTIAIVVVNTDEIDALLQQKWAGMKTALLEKNIESAIQFFAQSNQNLYSEIFLALIDRLPKIANEMQAISIIIVKDEMAKYRIRRIEAHNTGVYSITYYVYFTKDKNGIWKILRF